MMCRKLGKNFGKVVKLPSEAGHAMHKTGALNQY